MTRRPRRSSIDENLDDLYGRVPALERQVSGRWIYVGDYPGDPDTTIDSPLWIPTWVNIGPPKTLTRFRYLIGTGFELQMNATGGAPGSDMFQLPDDLGRYFPDQGELTLAAVDSVGGFTCYTINTSGMVRQGA